LISLFRDLFIFGELEREEKKGGGVGGGHAPNIKSIKKIFEGDIFFFSFPFFGKHAGGAFFFSNIFAWMNSM